MRRRGQTDIKTFGKTLKEFPLFQGVGKDSVKLLFDESEERSFKKGEDLTLLPPSLCLILKGRVTVRGRGAEGKVTLNTITEKGVFGAARLFGGFGNVSSVRTADKCEMLVIGQDTVEKLIREDAGFSLAYITFLSDRIRFLNSKIADFTSGNTENKLARFLLSKAEGDGEIKLGTSMARLSAALDVSRASLYRAFDSLEKKGLVSRKSGETKINSYKKLKELYGGKEK